MPVVEVRELLSATIDKVWNTICALEDYPRIMDPVRSLRILQEGDSWTEAEWEVELKGSLLRWIEREQRDPLAYRVTFEQASGDLDVFRGYWQLEKISEELTEAVLHIEFEIGIPMLKEMLDPIATRALTDNSRKMLLSLQPPVELAVTEQ